MPSILSRLTSCFPIRDAGAGVSIVVMLATGLGACAAGSDTHWSSGDRTGPVGTVPGAGAGGYGVVVDSSAGSASSGGSATSGATAGGASAGGFAAAGATGGSASAGSASTGGAMPLGGVGGTAFGGSSSAGPTCTNMPNLFFFLPGATMRPGEPCLSCHDGGKGPRFAVAGTVYPTAHEQNDCNGVNGATDGLKVEITDSTGRTTSIDVNSMGNFYYQGSLTPPYQAKVVRGTAARAMVMKQMSGDCNSCHAVNGVNGAPGRIMAP